MRKGVGKLVVSPVAAAVNHGPPSIPLSGTTKIEPTILSPTGADLSKLDADAVRATQRLITRGFEAYLVGGCVRDLLLGRTPKDYDIATEARPPQVKRTFPRNCRIIGRRFKLAHLHFHNNTKILECSTFRRTPQLENADEDLLITRDNEFGTAEEDALRRDFTVNALFLDPTRNCILDYTDGLTDLRNRVIRTIGDPRVRFREDPVRILRAAKFAGRLGFTIEPQTFAAMAEAGIDAALPVYWGAPGAYDRPNLAFSRAGLGPMVAALDRLAKDGAKTVKLGLFYDTSTLANDTRGAAPPGELAAAHAHARRREAAPWGLRRRWQSARHAGDARGAARSERRGGLPFGLPADGQRHAFARADLRAALAGAQRCAGVGAGGA